MLKTKNPATGSKQPITNVASTPDVVAAVARARGAFRTWRSISFTARGEYLCRAAAILEERCEDIAQTITGEMGRVLSESRGEVKKSAAFLRYFATNAEQALAPIGLANTSLGVSGKSAKILYAPRGVVALIKPWNAPIQQIVWGLGPALMAGCTVLVKPSEFTPESGLALQRAFDEAGSPSGVVQTLIGDRAVGAALVDADVDLVSFTGSRESGCKVAEAAGRRARKLILELSGKNTSIVDSNPPSLELVVPGLVYGAFSNCGQWCSSIERVLIPENLFPEISSRMTELTTSLKVGNGFDSSNDIGPVANERQFDHVNGLVTEAIQAGAKVLCGGRKLAISGFEAGYFFAPTILTDVPAECRIHRENIFGPVVVLHRYTKIDDAIASANSTEYGLGISIWTADPAIADLVTRESESGMVWVNEGLQSFAACPWSVTKGSGYGTELGTSGIREFCFEKIVQTQFEGNDAARTWYFPYEK